MFKRIALLFSLALLAPAAIQAKKPETFLGKLGTSIVQIANQHPVIASFPLALYAGRQTDNGGAFLLSWLFGAIATKTATSVLMNNFEIDPVQ